MKILIKVTREILEKSALCDTSVGFNCAIALAVREIFPKAWIGSNIINTISYVDSNGNIGADAKSEDIYLPEEARIFIEEFDNLRRFPHKRISMNPFSFEIDVPNEVIEEIGISQVYKILSESKTLELVNI